MYVYNCTMKYHAPRNPITVQVEAPDYSAAAAAALRRVDLEARRLGRHLRAQRETGVEPLSGIFQCYRPVRGGSAVSAYGPNIHVTRQDPPAK